MGIPIEQKKKIQSQDMAFSPSNLLFTSSSQPSTITNPIPVLKEKSKMDIPLSLPFAISPNENQPISSNIENNNNISYGSLSPPFSNSSLNSNNNSITNNSSFKENSPLSLENHSKISNTSDSFNSSINNNDIAFSPTEEVKFFYKYIYILNLFKRKLLFI